MPPLTRLFVLLPFLFSCFSLLAQADPYRLFRPDVQYLYAQPGADGDSILLGMRLGDGACEMAYSSMAEMSPQCFEVVPSFAGYKVCREEGTTRLDFGDRGDMILHPRAATGREWTALPGLRARVTGVTETDFLGLTDSVKSIGFYDADGNAVGDPMRISRRYGLIAGKLFWNLPQGDTTTLTLAGLSDPAVGVQAFGLAEVIDVEPGDVWHYYDYENSINTTRFDGGGNVVFSYSRHAYHQTTVTRVEVEDDSIVTVGLAGKQLTYKVRNSPSRLHYDSVLVEDFQTIRTLYAKNSAGLDKQPGSLLFDTLGAFVSYRPLWMTTDACGRGEKWFGPRYALRAGECDFDETAVDGQPASRRYKPHLLGRWNFENTQGGTFGSRIDYTRRADGSECGTPYDLADIIISTDEARERVNPTVFPNPVAEELTVRLPDGGRGREMVVLDIHGREVVRRAASRFTRIYVGELAAGPYVLLVTDDRGVAARRRVVVR